MIRPPVSIPEAATIMNGRLAKRIAFDSSTVSVNCWPGYISGDSPERRSCPGLLVVGLGVRVVDLRGPRGHRRVEEERQARDASGTDERRRGPR